MILEALILAAVGVIAGFMNVMAGGGSMLSVPVMIFLGIPGPVANGSNRIAIIAQNVSAVTAFARKGYSNFKLSLSLAAATMPGAIVGALVAARMEAVNFNRVLAVIMLLVLLIMWFGGNEKSGDDAAPAAAPSRRRLIAAHILMVGAGFWGGFIQIGIGFILMPILHRVAGLDLITTNMHKVFIVLVYTLVALAVFASQLQLAWLAGFALAAGMAIGAWTAAHTQVKRGASMIRLVLNVVLVLFIIRLLLFPA